MTRDLFTKISVKMSAYDWHILLDELAHLQRFTNRDTSDATRLHEEISKQLH